MIRHSKRNTPFRKWRRMFDNHLVRRRLPETSLSEAHYLYERGKSAETGAEYLVLMRQIGHEACADDNVSRETIP